MSNEQPDIDTQQILKALAGLSAAGQPKKPPTLEEILTALLEENANRRELRKQLEANEEYREAAAITAALFLVDAESKLSVEKTALRIRTVPRKGAIVASKAAMTFEELFSAQELVLRHFIQPSVALYGGVDQFSNNWEELREKNEQLFNALYWAVQYAKDLLPQAIFSDEDELGDFLDIVFSDKPSGRKIGTLLQQYVARGKNISLDVYWRDEQPASATRAAQPAIERLQVTSVTIAPVKPLGYGVLPEVRQLVEMTLANNQQGVFTLLYERGLFFRAADLSSQHYIEGVPVEVLALLRAGTTAYPFSAYVHTLNQEFGLQQPIIQHLGKERDEFLRAVQAYLPHMLEWIKAIALDPRFDGRDRNRPWAWRNSGQYSWSGVEIRP